MFPMSTCIKMVFLKKLGSFIGCACVCGGGYNHVKGECEINRDADAETIFHATTNRLQNQQY